MNSIRPHYFLLALLMLALVPFLWISFSSHPAADDYCLSIDEHQKGFWLLFADQYFSWSGRYSTNFLLLLNPMAIKSLGLYRLIPSLLILASSAGLYYFISAITNRVFSRIQVLNVSILFLLLYLVLMPSIAQGIYWYSSSMAYQTGIIFSLFYFGLLYNFLKEKYFISKSIHFSLTILSLTAGLGFNEGNTLLLITVNAFLAVIMLKQEKKITPAVRMLIFTGIVFAGLMLLAPGNSARGEYFPDSHNLLHSLWYTFLQTGRFGLTWGMTLPFLLSSVLFILFIHQYKKELPFFNSTLLKPLITAGIIIWIFFIFIFPPYWSTNILGQHRTVNAACFFFLAGWALFLCSMVQVISSEKLKKLPALNVRQYVGLMTVVILSLFITGNGYSVVSDLINGRISAFDSVMAKRSEALTQTQNTNALVYVEPLEAQPHSLFVLDLSVDSTYWVNLCQAQYFGVRSIAVKNEKE